MSVTHGLASTYRSPRYRCRCEPCTKAHTAYFVREIAKRAARLVADPSLAPHGHRSTYNNWGCRCEPCTQANKDACRDQHTRRKDRAAQEEES